MNRRQWLATTLLASLPVAACKKTDPASSLPELGTIKEFALTDQHGRPFGSGLRGKVWVASFFFTRCPTVCPQVMRRVRQVQLKSAAKGVSLQLVSFSVDPEHDTPPVLRKYAERFDADLSSWSFLTGDLTVVKKTCVEGFKLSLQGRPDANADHYGILHGSHLVLVDKNMKIRGYYRSSDGEAVARLLHDAARLRRA